MTPREQVLGIIRERQGDENVLAVPRAFIELTGDQAAALFLSQLLYWTDRSTVPGGWVYKSHAEWKQELGMGRSTVDRARRTLAGLGLLHQAYRQAHGSRTMFFRIDLPALRSALMSQTATPKPVRPERRVPTDPRAECRQTRVSSFDTPETETTAETTPETPAETTASSSSTRAKGEENLRSTENGGNRTGAPAPDSASGAVSVRDGPCESVWSAASAPGRHGSLPLREDTASTLAEDGLFAILERVTGFPQDRDRARLREVLADYPGVEHRLECKKFAAFYEKRTLDRPWFALRNWLERAATPPAHEPAPAPSAIDRTPSGPPRPLHTPRAPAQPLPQGLVVAGPVYEALMRRRRAASAAVPPGSGGGRTAP